MVAPELAIFDARTSSYFREQSTPTTLRKYPAVVAGNGAGRAKNEKRRSSKCAFPSSKNTLSRDCTSHANTSDAANASLQMQRDVDGSKRRSKTRLYTRNTHMQVDQIILPGRGEMGRTSVR
jgi:hypothetical protein